MKAMTNKILSVLLFSFMLSIFHDFTIAEIDKDTQYELCYAKYNKSCMDLASQIHDHFHVSLDIPAMKQILIPLDVAYSEPFDFQANLISYIHSVPQRPPLS